MKGVALCIVSGIHLLLLLPAGWLVTDEELDTAADVGDKLWGGLSSL